MYIEVVFKRGNGFSPKSYDYEVIDTPPKVGDIIRMYSADGSDKVCNGHRVKVVDVKETSKAATQVVRYVMSSLEEESLSKKG